MTVATPTGSLQRARTSALPRRGHLPPHGAEREEWDEGDEGARDRTLRRPGVRAPVDTNPRPHLSTRPKGTT
jgi:hypothetical protein